jgi:protocatechuate 3,4-dioxygenase beta subunit
MEIGMTTTAETKTVSRRKALSMIGTMSVAIPLANCGGSDSNNDSTTTTSSTNSTSSSSSSDATLSTLSLSSGSLSPTFNSATLSYTASVTNSVSLITITPTASNSSATIKVNGITVGSGNASNALSLNVGSNSISIIVTATDGLTSKTYSTTVVRAAASAGTNCAIIPTETQGPFPLLAVLTNAAVVRKNITEGKTGVPLTVKLKVIDVNNSCEPIANAAVYIWHCDKDGSYSGYSSTQNGNHAGETFLRGIQVTDSAGLVDFNTIYPGWYAGRITHIHLQVYLNDNLTVTATATSQLAFPQTITATVYSSTLYASHGQNTSVTSFAADNIFADGTSYQMTEVTGNTTEGYVATLTVGIAVPK